jgi:Flp pilus assembly protein TadG
MILRRLWGDQGGNTAIMFGLAVVPIIALAGGAVDFTHRADVRARVQAASDTAALAAARVMQNGEITREMTGDKVKKLKATARSTAENIFKASLAGVPEASGRAPNIRIENDSVTVSAELDVDTSFLDLIGIGQLSAAGLAEVNIPDLTLIEIAMVLDYSGSMRDNNKYIRMTQAAQTFISRVAEDRAATTKIGVVPFSEFVYATVPGNHIRDASKAESKGSVTACLLNRDYRYAVTDNTPRQGDAGSQWPRGDSAGTSCQAHAAGGLLVRELTSDFAALSDALGRMGPVGLTNIALAAEMGWHVLSANEPYTTGRDSADPIVRKIMILLTDGVQTVNAMGPNGGPSTLEADGATAELCRNATAAGVRIFTIAYDIEDERVRTLLSDCATAGGYHEAADGEIAGVFDAIYAQIAESVWLSR